MDALVLSAGGDDALREENWQLRQRLHGLESNQRLLERQNHALQRRVQQLEAQLSGRSEHSRRQESSAKREREWLAEHDSNVRALLHIIGHHEAAREELQRDVEQLRAKEAAAAAVVKVSRSAQTDRSHHRWTLQNSAADREADSQTSAYIKHLQDQLQQTKKFPAWCGAPTSQGVVTQSSVLMSTFRPDFRSSVLKRLNQSQSDHRPVIRPLPIPEGDEEEENQQRDGGELQDNQAHVTRFKDVTDLSSPPRLIHHCRGLEEQNRRLQERLESQQSLLDQLLSIKLDQVSSTTKPVYSACDALTSSVKTIQTSEQLGTSSSAVFPVPGSVQTSGKLYKQANKSNRASAFHFDSVARVSTSLPPPRQPHPMSPPAA